VLPSPSPADQVVAPALVPWALGEQMRWAAALMEAGEVRGASHAHHEVVHRAAPVRQEERHAITDLVALAAFQPARYQQGPWSAQRRDRWVSP